MLEQDSYLLQNQLNPFPVSGKLRLEDTGTLRFTLDDKAAGASLGWLEKQLATEGLAERIKGGERPQVFEIPLAGTKVSWPKTLGGYAMKIDAGERKWIVSLNYPSGGALWQTINMVRSRGATKPWKQAIGAASEG
jgi:hypothetical protein